MSLSNLTNAPYLNILCNNIACPQVNLSSALGNCTFLGTAVLPANYVAIASIMNGLVYLNIQITAVATGAVAPITFASPLPAEYIPVGSRNLICCIDNTSVATLGPILGIVAANGAFSLTLIGNSTNGNNYVLNTVLVYSL